MTQAQMIKAIRALRMTVRVADGEIRVNYPNGREATAYYTDDREDAVGTARAMSEHRS